MPTLPAIAAFIVGGVVLSAIVAVAIRTTAVSTATPLALAELGRRVLVIAPHPDDEVLATGGTLHRLVASGARVRVVLVTAGDSYRRAAARIQGGAPDTASYVALGEARHVESLAAAARLGLEATDVVSLGYADGAAQAMWDQSWDPSKPAEGRTGVTTVEYSWAAHQGAVMCGQDLAGDLESVVREFAPDTVISPDPYETHSDHAAVAAFASYAMDAAGFAGRRLTSIVHFRHYPYPWAHLPGAALNPPPQLRAPGTTWLAVPLDVADEQAKAAAIADYRSQTAIADLGLYMRAFVRTNELFARRVPAHVPVLATDARPSGDDSAAVLTTPAPVVPIPAGSTRPRIASVRIASGPQTAWIGLRCDGRVSTEDTYTVGVRLFGPDAPPARLDVSVTGRRTAVLRNAGNSIAPAGIRSEAVGDTLWIAVPAATLAGRTGLMIGATVARAGGSPMRTAWREVDL